MRNDARSPTPETERNKAKGESPAQIYANRTFTVRAKAGGACFSVFDHVVSALILSCLWLRQH